jgi:hypothetical protein
MNITFKKDQNLNSFPAIKDYIEHTRIINHGKEADKERKKIKDAASAELRELFNSRQLDFIHADRNSAFLMEDFKLVLTPSSLKVSVPEEMYTEKAKSNAIEIKKLKTRIIRLQAEIDEELEDIISKNDLKPDLSAEKFYISAKKR